MLAVDIVLLPDNVMTQRCIELNRLTDNRIVFSDPSSPGARFSCVPHISLAMGVLARKDLQVAEAILERIASEYGIFELVASYKLKSVKDDTISELTVGNRLQELHERIMNSFKPLFREKATAEMIFGYPNISLGWTLEWINEYAVNSSFNNFDPHITLGFGNFRADKIVDVNFKATTLAMFHLGSCCTCREKLCGIQLTER